MRTADFAEHVATDANMKAFMIHSAPLSLRLSPVMKCPLKTHLMPTGQTQLGMTEVLLQFHALLSLLLASVAVINAGQMKTRQYASVHSVEQTRLVSFAGDLSM